MLPCCSVPASILSINLQAQAEVAMWSYTMRCSSHILDPYFGCQEPGRCGEGRAAWGPPGAGRRARAGAARALLAGAPGGPARGLPGRGRGRDGGRRGVHARPCGRCAPAPGARAALLVLRGQGDSGPAKAVPGCLAGYISGAWNTCVQDAAAGSAAGTAMRARMCCWRRPYVSHASAALSMTTRRCPGEGLGLQEWQAVPTKSTGVYLWAEQRG